MKPIATCLLRVAKYELLKIQSYNVYAIYHLFTLKEGKID